MIQSNKSATSADTQIFAEFSRREPCHDAIDAFRYRFVDHRRCTCLASRFVAKNIASGKIERSARKFPSRRVLTADLVNGITNRHWWRRPIWRRQPSPHGGSRPARFTSIPACRQTPRRNGRPPSASPQPAPTPQSNPALRTRILNQAAEITDDKRTA